MLKNKVSKILVLFIIIIGALSIQVQGEWYLAELAEEYLGVDRGKADFLLDIADKTPVVNQIIDIEKMDNIAKNVNKAYKVGEAIYDAGVENGANTYDFYHGDKSFFELFGNQITSWGKVLGAAGFNKENIENGIREINNLEKEVVVAVGGEEAGKQYNEYVVQQGEKTYKAEETIKGVAEGVIEAISGNNNEEKQIKESEWKAVASKPSTSSEFTDPITNPDEYKNTGGKISEDNAQKIGTILGKINNIGVVVSVIALTIIGVRYMMGSVSERAEYKETMFPYVIGILLISIGTTVVNLLVKLAQILN